MEDGRLSLPKAPTSLAARRWGYDLSNKDLRQASPFVLQCLSAICTGERTVLTLQGSRCRVVALLSTVNRKFGDVLFGGIGQAATLRLESLAMSAAKS